ncbi:hypothetical protein M404DRAFT_35340 [Pisolithus tinctorius Marx 270]|uniref:Uncharacterized protein n=1 Tax=Pisolithus tinctorius Marx 270 TaxID=870435 RepID=A0A0C3NF66_PISTI|nr:hypothetical protein M404DRAFT_35340 [Pisolithus tinctorius Marx 270]
MSFQRENTTPQPTPGHSCDYSQVTDNALVVLTDDLTDTKREKNMEKACRQREEEEAQWKKAVEEEAERQRQRAAEEAEKQRQRAQARRDEATQRLSGAVYNVNTAQRVPGTSVVVTMTRQPPCTCCIASLMVEENLQLDVGRGGGGTLVEESRDGEFLRREEEEDMREGKGESREDEEEPATPHEGPLEAGVSSWWMEWEQEQQLQVAERYAAAHKKVATAFERMARAAEWMVVAAEQTANEWALMAEVKHTGGGWKRPQSEVAEDKNEEADEGAEGDNEEEEEVGGEKEGGEEQEGGGGQAMEE